MSTKTAALFAGQGAQAVGMAKDLADSFPEAAALFAKADDILGFSLSKVVFEGPAESLAQTDICQPAIFTASAAAYVAFRAKNPGAQFDMAAGLSLGEWTALWAAGAVSFEEAVRILQARGRFMQEACEQNPSGMVSVLKLPVAQVEEVAAQTGCTVTNYNSALQTVLAGTKEQVAAAAEAATAKGARAVVLNVVGAYHSPFMTPAAEKLEAVLASADIKAPSIPVLSNYTGAFHTDADEIRASMVKQVNNPVRWTSDMDAMSKAGAVRYVEFGPGRVLSGLVKRDVAGSETFNVGAVADIDKAAAAFA